MDIKSLFKIAIDQEIEACEFYKKASEKVSNPGVKDIFMQLSADEAGHAETLRKYEQDSSLVGKFVSPEVDYAIADSNNSPELSITMKPADAIMLAAKKEQDASEFYTALSKKATDKEIVAMLQSLAAMELGHKQKLENAFVQVGYPESF
ncbi:MAG: ferritin family protein [Fibrobacter sp.]|nr:ferritin family protein [Fibrobacter sp.]